MRRKLLNFAIFVMAVFLNITAIQAQDPIFIKGCGVNGGGALSHYSIHCPGCCFWTPDGGITTVHACGAYDCLNGIVDGSGMCPKCIEIDPAPDWNVSGHWVINLLSTGQWWTIISWTTVENDDGSSDTTFVPVGDE